MIINIRYVYNGQVHQQGSGAKIVLKPDAVLIGIVGHEIDQHIGNQQDAEEEKSKSTNFIEDLKQNLENALPKDNESEK